MLYIGCHLSSSRGLAAMGRQALDLGANTFQFFTRNPRGSRAKPLDEADAAVFCKCNRYTWAGGSDLGSSCSKNSSSALCWALINSASSVRNVTSASEIALNKHRYSLGICSIMAVLSSLTQDIEGTEIIIHKTMSASCPILSKSPENSQKNPKGGAQRGMDGILVFSRRPLRKRVSL